MRLLTGVRPTGDLHIGNYFGAIHPLLNLGEESNELFLFVADLHALTSSHDYDSIRSNTLKLTAALISLGFDTEKNTLWIQSNVPVVCEFMYLLSTLTGFQYLRKGHAFKAALQEVSNPSVALFLYPVLMAADILCFQADAVPVGQDQKQHLEICRDLAERLNLVCPQAVKVPEAIILEEVALIPGIDGRKMSKSYGNTIPIFEDDKSLFERFKKIKTDSTPLGKPISLKESIVGKYLQLFDSPENFNSLVVEALEGRLGWGDLKSLAYEKFLSYFARQRLVYNEISKDSEHLEKILRIGAEKASAVAVDTVSSVIQKFNPVTLC